MIATVRNMRIAETTGLNVCAVDREGQTFSATPGDYFWMPDDLPLTEDDGTPLHLALVVTRDVDTDALDALVKGNVT